MENNFFSDFKKYEWPTLGYILLPKYQPSAEDIKEYGMDEAVTSYENLKRVARAGYKKRTAEKLLPQDEGSLADYLHRIKYELEVFESLGFSDYILMVNSITDYARRNGIISGAGRGSCVGSLILFLIGVTQVDPIRGKLIFERFISAERAQKKEINGRTYIDSSSLPDVDLDFPMSRKDEVRKFIESRFPNRVASIANFTRLTSKLLMKEVVKIVEQATEEQAQTVSDIIDKKFGKVQDINEAMRENKSFMKWMTGHEKSVEIACKLSDIIKNKSVHASGLIITENEIDASIPLEMTKGLDEDNRHICSVYDMVAAQKLGIKIDNLGLKTLDSIGECLRLTGKKLHEINPEDTSIYAYLQNRNEFHGLFQIEAGIGEQTIKKVRPKNLEELTDCISLGRPGSYKFIDDYVAVKNGKKTPKIHEKLVDILEPTKGILIFQEQLMSISVRMAGFSLIEADKIRKIVGKKKREEMPEWEKKFIDGSIANGFEEAFAKGIWQSFIDSADYSFNKSHGRAYATLTAITTYLKAHHPLEFFLSCLKIAMVESESQKVIGKIYSEMLKNDIKLLPPHLLKSDYDFKIEGNGIRFGLMAIKGLKEKVIEKVARFRDAEADTGIETNTNLFHFFKVAGQAGLTIGALSALIQAGACDVPTGKTRSKIVAEAQLWNLLKDKEREMFEALGEKFNYDIMSIMVHLRDDAAAKEASGHKFAKGELKTKRIGTIRKHFGPYNEILKINSKAEKFTNWYYQRKLLGFCYDENLKEIFAPAVYGLVNIAEANELEHKESCVFMAVVEKTKEALSQKVKDDGTKTRYLKLDLSDETGSTTVLAFNDNIEKIKAKNGKPIVEGDIVRVIGERFNDAIFAKDIRIHSHEVFTKLSDLKNAQQDKKSEEATI